LINICIIPARGGSKRIPKKNIKIFLGKPIINYVIKAAKISKIFNYIIVSTDDKKIANITKKKGVLIHKRKKSLSKDNVGTTDVILDIIKTKKFNFKEPYKICCIYPTSVFCTSKLLKKANTMLTNKTEYIFSAVRYGHPILRSFKRKKNNVPEMFFKNYEQVNTQQIPPTYHDAAQFYFGWVKSWKKKNQNIFTSKSKFIELDILKSHDIDNHSDWIIAEMKYKKFFNKRSPTV